MKLCLADGAVFAGRSFGANREVHGEVVFNTGMTGYVETLTDPSYRGQILVMTYPLVGNYGVPTGGHESDKIQVQGLIVSHYSSRPSHHSSVKSLGDWLRADGIPAVEAIDTRSLTRRLRERGTMEGHLIRADSDLEVAKRSAERVDMKQVHHIVSSKEITRYPGGGDLRLLVIDTGAKENIIRSLQSRGASVVRAPFAAPWEPLLKDIDGVMLTNGPGDPADMAQLAERVRLIFARGIPVFGICLGHQLLSLAAGARTYKLKYGHRSHNQPVMDLTSRRAFLTSQNHGYAVLDSSLPADWAPWYVNLNDGTNEGIRHRYRPFWSVQFHPEAAAGPRDTAFLFDDFLRVVGEMKRGIRHDEKLYARVAAVAT